MPLVRHWDGRSHSPLGRHIFTLFTGGTTAAAESQRADLTGLEAEIALLREDNARLRIAQAQRPDAGSLIARVRAMVEQLPDGGDRHPDDQGDEIFHLLSEAIVMRNVLIDVCEEVGRASVTMQGRLEEMTGQPSAGAVPAGLEALSP